MSAHSTANHIEGTVGFLAAGLFIAGERAIAEGRQRRHILAHNAEVAAIRAARRRRAAAETARVAQVTAVGEARMARWIDRVSH